MQLSIDDTTGIVPALVITIQDGVGDTKTLTYPLDGGVYARSGEDQTVTVRPEGAPEFLIGRSLQYDWWRFRADGVNFITHSWQKEAAAILRTAAEYAMSAPWPHLGPLCPVCKGEMQVPAPGQFDCPACRAKAAPEAPDGDEPSASDVAAAPKVA